MCKHPLDPDVRQGCDFPCGFRRSGIYLKADPAHSRVNGNMNNGRFTRFSGAFREQLRRLLLENARPQVMLDDIFIILRKCISEQEDRFPDPRTAQHDALSGCRYRKSPDKGQRFQMNGDRCCAVAVRISLDHRTDRCARCQTAPHHLEIMVDCVQIDFRTDSAESFHKSLPRKFFGCYIVNGR